jgi:hypothetical protein
VGVEDIVTMAARWGYANATLRWDPLFDLNLDSRIDILDIMLVTASGVHLFVAVGSPPVIDDRAAPMATIPWALLFDPAMIE